MKRRLQREEARLALAVARARRVARTKGLILLGAAVARFSQSSPEAMKTIKELCRKNLSPADLSSALDALDAMRLNAGKGSGG